MTFKEYIKGLKELPEFNAFYIRLYNKRVSSLCNFSVNLGQLMNNLAKASGVDRDSTKTEIKFVDWFADKKQRKDFLAVISASVVVPTTDNNQSKVDETIARFRTDDNTQFTDGTTLRENTYYNDDYGRRTLKLLPECDLDKIIVPIDVTQEYMLYPRFLKALLKSDVIEQQVETIEDIIKKTL